MVKEMTSGKPLNLLLSFSVPLLIGNIFQQFYNMVDAVVVGNFTGPEALAAVGSAGNILFFAYALAMGLTLGSTVVISQCFGAEDFQSLKKAIAASVHVMLGACIFVTVLGVGITRPLLILIKTPPDIIDEAAKYLYIMFGCSFTLVFYNGLSSILRGLGDSRTPLIFLIIASLINVVLDLFFVIVFKMGVSGVAWATAIAQGISAVLCFIYMRKKVPYVHLSREEMKINKSFIWKTVKIGLPSAIQQVFVSSGMMAVQGVVNSFGTTFVAAYTVASRIEIIAMMPSMSFGMAMETYTGQNIGAGKIDRVKAGYRDIIKLSLGVSIVLGVIIFFFGNHLIEFFVPAENTQVIQMGSDIIKITGSFCFLPAFLFPMNSLLRGSGDTLMPMLASFIELFGRVIFAYMMAPIVGYTAVGWSRPVAFTIALTVVFIRYFSGKWMTKAVISPVSK